MNWPKGHSPTLSPGLLETPLSPRVRVRRFTFPISFDGSLRSPRSVHSRARAVREIARRGNFSRLLRKITSPFYPLQAHTRLGTNHFRNVSRFNLSRSRARPIVLSLNVRAVSSFSDSRRKRLFDWKGSSALSHQEDHLVHLPSSFGIRLARRPSVDLSIPR